MKQESTTDQPEDPVLTTRAAANLLGVSVSTAQQWIENGAIDSWKTPGGHRRVRLSAVMKLLEDQGNKPEAPLPGGQDGEFAPQAEPQFPTPDNEAQRLRLLAETGLIDTPPEQVFDRLTWLATEVTQAPMALVSLLTSRRQWFKSRVGLDASETPREWAFCSHAILEPTPMIVEDALNDARFRDNPLVLGDPHIRFYAGFPLRGKNEVPLGTLCVLDRVPRRLDERQIHALNELAAIASEEIKRRA